jgi:hypothetical protein
MRHVALPVVDSTVPAVEKEGRPQARLMNMKKITSPLLMHLLGGRLRFPALFLLRCKLTLPGFKRNIDPAFPRELVELAALPMWVYINLKKRIGQGAAFEVMRVAILTGGIAQWNLAYRTSEEKRTFQNLCDAELRVNQSGLTRWNTMQVVERTERHFEIKITRCRYHELATSLGVPELTPVVCQIDNAAFNSYLPDRVVFQRGGVGRRIADGAKECSFVWNLVE